jgi:predicted lipase
MMSFIVYWRKEVIIMSYEKAMKHSRNHKKDKFYQPILGMPFKENEHVESYHSITQRTATGYNVRVYDNIKREYIQVSEEFETEDKAVDFIDNLSDFDKLGSRIYSTEGMHISGW